MILHEKRADVFLHLLRLRYPGYIDMRYVLVKPERAVRLAMSFALFLPGRNSSFLFLNLVHAAYCKLRVLKAPLRPDTRCSCSARRFLLGRSLEMQLW